jgi:hypothetical protein
MAGNLPFMSNFLNLRERNKVKIETPLLKSGVSRQSASF